MLSMVFVMITLSIASAERVTEVLNEKADICNPENPVMEVKDGSVVFDHVDFRYKKDAPDYALKGIDLSIRSGETIIFAPNQLINKIQLYTVNCMIGLFKAIRLSALTNIL